MKKLITLATLIQMGTASASVIAVMDTGTDISHKDLVSKAWVNKKEKVGSKTDLDGSGLPGDVNGWDFTENSAKVFNDKYNYLLTADVVKFFALYAKYETKTIIPAEFDALKLLAADKKFMNQVDFVGGYAHGTHVGGIATINNPNAKVMSLKILPTVFHEYVEPPKDGVAPKKDEPSVGNAITVDAFNVEIAKQAMEQVQEMIPLNGYLKFQKVDAVNQSFGIGFKQAVEFITAGFVESVKREPTKDELAKAVGVYFQVILKNGPAMFSAAPDTVFVIAAGNDTSDNDKLPDYPASVQAPNKIVVAATLGYSELAEFSNYGAKKVDVAAPGVAIQSTAPNQSYVFMSGTSQAAPFVTNTAGLVKDANPALKATDIKAIILGTVDVKAWLKDKVATSGIVNKARAVRAAELSKTMNLDLAIAKAKTDVLNVAVNKSFARRLPGMILNYKPIRPSLLVKLPTL